MKEEFASTIDEDSFEIIEREIPLHLNSRYCSTLVGDADPYGVEVQLHPLPGGNDLLISVVPPLTPQNMTHGPCDIVLVIDVSGSMRASAPLPTTDETGHLENTGLSVLDLTKHAARTIIENLNERDRLGIVTFSIDAKIVHNLSYMTEKSKKRALRQIESLEPEDVTNLWHGLKEGLRVLEDADTAPENVKAVYVLTDGKPNHMCPKQGYVPKLQQILGDQDTQVKQLPSIHTFGFGYSIRSGLLQSIAEVGGGSYSFIPDAGMIGTVFVHAVANLFTTFATQAMLTFHTTASISLEQDEGTRSEIQMKGASSDPKEILVRVGNLQYGQSRDVLLHYETTAEGPHSVQAKLTYNVQGSIGHTFSNERFVSDTTSLPATVYDYHRSRTRICAFLKSLFPLRYDQEHVPLRTADLPRVKSELESLTQYLKGLGHSDEQNMSLLQDIDGQEPNGQVRIALSRDEYYNKWGQHYLLSLLNAHTHQICNSFKDSGPLQYGKNSPLFKRWRVELDTCFDNLPAPKPSLVHNIHGNSHGTNHQSFSMSRYNRSSDPCFAGRCRIRLPKGNSIAVRDLRPGMSVLTPIGSRRVSAVVVTPIRNSVLCKIGKLLITPWHPIQETSFGKWVFPCEISTERVRFTGTIYSILLAASANPDAHAVMIDGQVCVTLGHGIRGQAGCDSDARAHTFFGSYKLVSRNLRRLPRSAAGLSRANGVKRDAMTGLVCGFRSGNRTWQREAWGRVART